MTERLGRGDGERVNAADHGRVGETLRKRGEEQRQRH